MKNKKLISLLTSAVLTAALLSGCGSTQLATAQTDTAESDTQETESEPDDELSDIQKVGKIVVGIEGTYPPFTYHDDDGNLVGYDVEVAQEIASYLGVEVEFVESDWDSLLAGVDSGRLDTVINDVTVTEERAGKYDFSNPYYFNSRQFIVTEGNPENIHSIEDLDGKKLATNSTNANIDDFESWGLEIIPIDSAEEQADLLLSGRTDVGTFSSVILADYLDQHPDAGLEVAFIIPDSEEQIAIPVRKGETRLLDAINEALAQLDESGKLAELSDKYFHADYTKSQEN